MGNNVRELREARGLSQSDLAAKAGVNPKMLARIEEGRKQPAGETLRAVALALGVEPAELAAGP
jgi:transcriptional regulator with XRE-family HTH domain